MPRTIVLELAENQAEALDRVALSLHTTPTAATALLMDEALRHEQFPQVEFRDSPCGRQAYVTGSTLAVWEVVMVAEAYELDPLATARHLEWAPARVEGVLSYYRAHRDQIDEAIAENDAITPEQMKQSLPGSVCIA